MDEHYKVAITRLGDRLRVAGMAELGGAPDVFSERGMDTLYRVLHDWFPGLVQLQQLQRWKGARPMLPDGPPLIGAAATPGLWLNLGHGSSGWALSCGSARALADRVAGREPALDLRGFSPDRPGLR
jgi:D-amino-acid dehydrogenase